MKRRVAVSLLVLVAWPSVAACTSSGTAKSSSEVINELGDVTDMTGKTEVTIDVVDNAYKPKVTKVSPGTKVTFHNTGVNPHNVTPFDDGAFTALTLSPGQSAELTAPQKAGDLPFYCTIHGGRSSGQRGALVVAAPF